MNDQTTTMTTETSNPKTPNSELVQFVRFKDGKNIGMARGVVVALQTVENENVVVKFGWSNVRKGTKDIFDKEFGLKIARDRALKGSKVVVPKHVVPVMNYIKERAIRYFKGALVA